MEYNGSAAAAGFYLGLEDGVTKKLKGLRRTYALLLDDLLEGNEKVQKSIEKINKSAHKSGMALVCGSAQAATPGIQRKRDEERQFKLSLEPKKGPGLFRRLFGNLEKRMRTQVFSGMLTPFAKGGLVKGPMAGLVGEKGPEAVIPVSKMGDFFKDVFSKAVQSSAGKAHHPMGGDVAGALIGSLFKERGEIEALTRLLQRANRSEALQVHYAEKIASLMADQAKAFFKTDAAFDVFREDLKKKVIPAMAVAGEQSASFASGLAKSSKKNKEQLYGAAALTVVLEGVKEGAESLEKMLDTFTSRAEMTELVRTLGMTRHEAANLQTDFSHLSNTIVATTDLMGAAVHLRTAGLRNVNQIRALADTTAKLEIMGVAGDDAGRLVGRMSSQLGIADKDIASFAGSIVKLKQTNSIEFGDIMDNFNDAVDVFQGFMKDMPGFAKKAMLESMMSSAAAIGSVWQKIDVKGMMQDAFFDPIESQIMAANLGFVSRSDLQTAMQAPGGISDVLSQMLTKSSDMFQQLLSSGMDQTMAQMQTQTVMGMQFGVLGRMEPAAFTALMKNVPELTKRLNENRGAIKNEADMMSFLNTQAAQTVGLSGRIMNFLKHLAGATGLTKVASVIQQFQVLEIAQAIPGIALSLGGIVKMLGKIPGISGPVIKMLTWWRGMGAAGAVAEGAGAGAAVSGLLEGLAVGVAAITPVLPELGLIAAGIGVLALAIGGALRLAAPGLHEISGMVTGSLTAIMNGFSHMDATQILATGLALPAIGIGFSAMAAGLVTGLAMLGTANLVSGVGAFFGMGSGKNVGEMIEDFIDHISKLVDVASKVNSLPSVIKLPRFEIDAANLQDTMNATAPLRVQAADSPVVNLLEKAVHLLERIAHDAPGMTTAPSGSGMFGDLLRAGGAR